MTLRSEIVTSFKSQTLFLMTDKHCDFLLLNTRAYLHERLARLALSMLEEK